MVAAAPVLAQVKAEVVEKQVTESFLVQPTNQGTSQEYEVLALNLYPGSLGLGDLGARNEAEAPPSHRRPAVRRHPRSRPGRPPSAG